MREICGTAGEYLSRRTLPYELESDGQEFGFEGGESEQKHIYRPLA